jgi:hypothetical protein
MVLKDLRDRCPLDLCLLDLKMQRMSMIVDTDKTVQNVNLR